MKIVKLNQITDKLFDLRKHGNYPGESTGFRKLQSLYTIRRGNTTYITGYPSSGKTQMYFQLLCNTTSIHDWRHVIYSPETGNAEEIYAEIIHCLTGKTLSNSYCNQISESELYRIKDFVSDYFIVIDPSDKDNTLENWFEKVKEAASEVKKIDTAGIDNWNDLEHNMTGFSGKISEYLKYQLPVFNKFAKKENIHGFILVHPRNPDGIRSGDSLPAPRHDQIEGGSLWAAKAQNILIVHRDFSDENSFRTDLTVSKVKPKIVGKRGMAELFFDPRLNSYYETIDGLSVYPPSPFKIDTNERQRISDQIQTDAF